MWIPNIDPKPAGFIVFLTSAETIPSLKMLIPKSLESSLTLLLLRPKSNLSRKLLDSHENKSRIWPIFSPPPLLPGQATILFPLDAVMTSSVWVSLLLLLPLYSLFSAWQPRVTLLKSKVRSCNSSAQDSAMATHLPPRNGWVPTTV